jgi:hypothetical protein
MDTVSLTTHLEKQKQALQSLNSGNVPAKHKKAGTVQAYKEYLQREIARTERKIEAVKGIVPKIGAK